MKPNTSSFGEKENGNSDNSIKDELDDLTKPVKAIEEKWKLLPHFLRMRGVMRQHIDSFDDFINVEIKNIVAARSNFEVRSEADPKFFLRYTDIYVGEPNVEEESFVTSNGRNNTKHQSYPGHVWFVCSLTSHSLSHFSVVSVQQ